MTTPQNTPVGKHAAPGAQQTSQEGPQAGHGQGGVPLVRLVNAGKRYGAVIALSGYHDGGRARRGHLRAG